ncbi:MAG: outer membrane protein assembly factor BamE [Alcanivorax sp.]
MQKIVKFAFSLLLIFFIQACTPVTSQHGNMLEDFQVQEVKAGEHTRSDVLRILGSPTTQSTFNPNIWYYLGQETEKRGILDQHITDERIVVVMFRKDGVVDAIQEVDSERENIPFARTKTPTHGNDLTFIQQLLGNLGRFNTPQNVSATGDLDR